MGRLMLRPVTAARRRSPRSSTSCCCYFRSSTKRVVVGTATLLSLLIYWNYVSTTLFWDQHEQDGGAAPQQGSVRKTRTITSTTLLDVSISTKQPTADTAIEERTDRVIAAANSPSARTKNSDTETAKNDNTRAITSAGDDDDYDGDTLMIAASNSSTARSIIPTHTACQDDNVHGIYHVAMGDIGGAAGTVFFQFVIAQILYAERHRLKPWVHLNAVSHVVYDPAVHSGHNNNNNTVTLTALTGRNATYYRRPGGHRRDATPGPPDSHLPLKQETLHFTDTDGIWQHYFDPVSDFVPGDRSCQSKLYVTMDLYLITPGLHGYAEYAPRCWRYKYLPDYISKPHLGVTEWLAPQRRQAYRVTQTYFRPRAYLLQAAKRVNPDCSRTTTSPCLGLHIRHSDKSAGRRVIATAEFLPFVLAFLDATATNNHNNNSMDPHIYIATDSALVLQEIEATWPPAVQSRIRTLGANVLRSTNEQAVFDLDGASQHHRTNQEVLIEILALSACQFMVHGYSAVSESAVWMNLDLHDTSINLEDPDHLNATQFQDLVQMVLAADDVPRDQWPRPVSSADVWPELYQPPPDTTTTAVPTHKACDGYNGILLISVVGGKTSAAGAFFTSILNQLVYAEKHNLKPWIHLRNNDTSTEYIYDDKVHGQGGDGSTVATTFEMMHGMSVSVAKSKEDPSVLYPDVPALRTENQTQKEFTVYGSGIWNCYFEPVSNDFVPGDESCRSKPIIEMEDVLVSGMKTHAPWAVRAWRYDNVPEDLWWSSSATTTTTTTTTTKDAQSLQQWYEPMRLKGSEIIQKYYRFQPFIQHRAEEVNPVSPDQPCLGLHLRNGDKFGDHRSKVSPKEFEPYLDVFERAGGRAIYIASDSHRAMQFVNKNFPERITKLIRSQGKFVVRSTKLDWSAHYLEDHHRVNSEVLVDILALSKCKLLLHGFSTVSEAAIYLNPSLHRNSVNLEDPTRISPEQFGIMVTGVTGGAA